MSDDAEASTSSEYKIVDFKDGQLQIVEVTPFDRQDQQSLPEAESILPELSKEGSGQHKLMQVFDDKGLVHLDLLNLTLVRCEDNEEAYRLVDNAESDGEANDGIACVLQSSDGEGDNDSGEYVMMGDEQVPLVFLTQNDEETDTQEHNNMNISEETDTQEHNNMNISEAIQENVVQNKQDSAVQIKEISQDENNTNKKLLTPVEILEKVKALQKSSLLPPPLPLPPGPGGCGPRGRKRRAGLPPPRTLLASPDLKLFLYECKKCNFKCNAVKQLTEHRLSEHNPNKNKPRFQHRSTELSEHNPNKNKPRLQHRSTEVSLQCSHCIFSGDNVTQLMAHIKETHSGGEIKSSIPRKSQLYPVQCSVDVLVCGACGFESISSQVFKKHFQDEHGTKLSSS